MPEQGIIGKLLKNSDALIAVGVGIVIIMMVMPVWTVLLNLGIAASIAIALIILLTVIYSPRAVDFAVFPSLLLVTTTLRLALNVAATRKILLEGKTGVEGIITAFGDFVVGGNYIVGVVIFLVLVLVQIMVITKGATRIAEVAARFTLEAMPMKQMAIDGEVQRGDITPEEANKKRQDLSREANFYGAMDGAAKFVQGDVYAALVITGVNIVGGLGIGMWQRGEGLMEALQTYALLTIGDGLAAQLPSLMISVAAGLIVTRSTSEMSLSKDIVRELLHQPRALYIAAGFLAVLGPIPGMPILPLWTLAAGLFAVAYQMRREEQARAVDKLKAAQAPAEGPRKAPEKPVALLQVDQMELEIGYGLIALVDAEQGGDLLDRITLMRKQCALDYGIIVPPIRVRDNIKLRPESYVVKIKNTEVGGSELRAGKFLAMDAGKVRRKLPGEEVREPAFGLPAVWLPAEQREEAELAGYTVVDPPTIIATHMTEIIKRHAPELLSLQDVKELLDNLKKDYPAVIDELKAREVPMMTVLQVLRSLLREKVSIRNLVTILEVLCEQFGALKDPLLREQFRGCSDHELLAEFVRAALAPQLCEQHLVQGALKVLTLAPRVEETINRAVQPTGDVALHPRTHERVLDSLRKMLEDVVSGGGQPILLVSPRLRVPLRRLTERLAPGLTILSYNEVVPTVAVESLGMIDAEVA